MSNNQRIAELDVERINVVDCDGTLRMTISNKDTLPNPVLHGKEFVRQGPKVPGIIFYNDDGDECGGLMFGGTRDPNGDSGQVPISRLTSMGRTRSSFWPITMKMEAEHTALLCMTDPTNHLSRRS
jgi:hypothetical protein